MKTVIETTSFAKNVTKIWTDDERLEFITWIAVNYDAGDVIPNAEGVRKIRWNAAGMGKRGGVRVIYYNVDAEKLILIDLYRKNKKSNISISEIERAK